MRQLELDDFTFAGEYPWRDEDLMWELHVEKALTDAEISELFRCHLSTVGKWREKHGIENHRGHPKEVFEVLHDPRTLRQLYVEQRLTAQEIADRIDAKACTVRSWLENHDIPRRGAHTRRMEGLSQRLLETLYINHDMTMQEIADELDVGMMTVSKRIHGYSIPVDSSYNGGSQAVIQNPQTLQRLYVDWGLSTHEVAEWLRLSATVVSDSLDRLGIDARREGEPLSNGAVKDEDVLRELYVEKDFSQRGVAEKLGVAIPSVRKHLKRHGFEIKPPTVQRRGERSPHWKGGTENYYGPLWRTRRQQAIERDDRQCQKCGMSLERHVAEHGAELHVHHIVRYADFDDDETAHSLNNLITVCYSCHGDIEGLPIDNRDRERHADAEARGVL